MEKGSGLTGRRDALTRLLQAGGLGAASAALGFWLHGRSHRPEEAGALTVKKNFAVLPDPRLPEMVVAQGDDLRELAARAVRELGGIRRFIARGDVVAIKPNMAWDRTPEQAANTNPALVAAVVRLCQEAGAKKVIVTDASTHEARRVYQRSGIAAAARAEGAQVILPEERMFKEVNLQGEVLELWPVFEPFIAADKVINLPIAKQHSLTGATLGMKNWYGILGGQRHRLHQRIHESLADLADFMRPTLTIIDAYRVLIRNGPVGGNLGDVELRKTIIAGTDAVALDAYAYQAFWNMAPEQVRYLQLAQQRGLGQPDLTQVRSRTITV